MMIQELLMSEIKHKRSPLPDIFRGRPFSKERKTQFMQTLSKTGSISKTCELLRVDKATIVKARKRSRFEERIQNAFARYGRRINGNITAARKKLRVPFDEGMQRVYLENVAATGLKVKSGDMLGIHPDVVRRLLDSNEEFLAKFEDAKQRFNETLEEEMLRRGRDGYDAYINIKGGKMMLVKKYSDKLLLAAARRHIPEYRTEQAGATQQINAGVLVVNNVQGSLDAKSWEGLYGGDRSNLPPVDIVPLNTATQANLLPENNNVGR